MKTLLLIRKLLKRNKRINFLCTVEEEYHINVLKVSHLVRT